MVELSPHSFLIDSEDKIEVRKRCVELFGPQCERWKSYNDCGWVRFKFILGEDALVFKTLFSDKIFKR